MGLDMNLSLKVYLGNYEWAPENQKTCKAIFEALGIRDTSPFNDGSVSISLPVGYWRKANAIHAWFVQNIQDGVDECQEALVTSEQLEELRKTCQKVLLVPGLASENLPTESGFCFGDTNYGQHYMEGLKDTVQIIDKTLALAKELDGSIYYQSSW